MAKMITEAIEFPGFAFIQALSHCITFCPEQSKWKDIVRPFDQEATRDPVVAAQRIHADDGFSAGVIYRNPRRCWPVEVLDATGRNHIGSAVEELGKEFKL